MSTSKNPNDIDSPDAGPSAPSASMLTTTTATVMPEPVVAIPIPMASEASLVSSPETAVPLHSGEITTEQLEALKAQGFTDGLARAMVKNLVEFPFRIWLVDNSGSMVIEDGSRLVESSSKEDVKAVECSRWSELQQTVEYHSQLAALLKAPIEFRLLNDPGATVGPQTFSIGKTGVEDKIVKEELEVALSTIRGAYPSGPTPLAKHLRDVKRTIEAMIPFLNGTRIVLVIATDGLPTATLRIVDAEREFLNALRDLQGLPVWIVIRLCTDEPAVVDFYNDLDAELELNLEVLDDYMGEAREVQVKNAWMNYALPLYRMREVGFHHRLTDLMDERPLAKKELLLFCQFLFGEELMSGSPNPEVDMAGFMTKMESVLQYEKKQWNPRTRKMGPWIEVKKLKNGYGAGGGGCCTIS